MAHLKAHEIVAELTLSRWATGNTFEKEAREYFDQFELSSNTDEPTLPLDESGVESFIRIYEHTSDTLLDSLTDQVTSWVQEIEGTYDTIAMGEAGH